MRGQPLNPVLCSKCGGPHGAPKDNLCARCRLGLHNPRLRFRFTPELDEKIRRVYADNGHNRNKLVDGITALARSTGYQRHAITRRAQKLGVTVVKMSYWTPPEIELVRKYAGARTVHAIARLLGRTDVSVSCMVYELGLSQRLREGYSREDAAAVFGVSVPTVRNWIASRWLVIAPATDRITERSIRRFIREHSEKYSLKRVDEAWFKGMVFPAFGLAAARKSPASEGSAALFPFRLELPAGKESA